MFLNLAGYNISLLSKGSLAGYNISLLSKRKLSCSLIWQVTIFRYYQKEAFMFLNLAGYNVSVLSKGSFHVP